MSVGDAEAVEDAIRQALSGTALAPGFHSGAVNVGGTWYIYNDGGLRFAVPPAAPCADTVHDRVPVTAIFDDRDGIPVYFPLHVQDGRLWELEVYKADGSRILQEPSAAELHF